VLVHFENTPKAFANFSPGFERSENPGFSNIKVLRTLKGSSVAERFQRFNLLCFPFPRLSLCSNLGLKLANAFGVIPTNSFQG